MLSTLNLLRSLCNARRCECRVFVCLGPAQQGVRVRNISATPHKHPCNWVSTIIVCNFHNPLGVIFVCVESSVQLFFVFIAFNDLSEATICLVFVAVMIVFWWLWHSWIVLHRWCEMWRKVCLAGGRFCGYLLVTLTNVYIVYTFGKGCVYECGVEVSPLRVANCRVNSTVS